MRKSNTVLQNVFSVLFLLIIITNFTSAYSQEIDLSTKEKYISLVPFADFLEDPNHVLTIRDMNRKDLQWFKIKSTSTKIGFSESVHWIRFSLKNNSNKNKNYFLQIANPLLDKIEIFISGADSTAPVYKTGDRDLFKKRPRDDRNFLIPLSINARHSEVVYVRLQSESSLNFRLNLVEEDGDLSFFSTEDRILMIYYGMIFIFIAATFISLIFIRKIYNLYFAGFLITFTLFLASQDGTAFQFLWPQNPNWAHLSIPLFLCLSLIFGSLIS